MANQKRKVSFFLLSLEKHIYNADKNTTSIKIFNNDELEAAFQKVYSSMKELKNKHRAIDVHTSSNDYVVEIIEYKDHIVFARIGQQNYANTAALRDRTTLESEEVPMKENQLLELYTFCLIDLSTGVVSYIGINGAPKISAIKFLFDQVLCQEDVVARLAAILTNDILKTLVNKHVVSQMSITVAVPDDTILSNVVGLSEKSFDNLRNVKTKTATYKIVGTRNKNLFDTSQSFAALVGDIKSTFGDKLRSLKVNAKDYEEPSQSYDLLEYNFTKTVTLGDRPYYLLTEVEFKEILMLTYTSNKEELLVYIR